VVELQRSVMFVVPASNTGTPEQLNKNSFHFPSAASDRTLVATLGATVPRIRTSSNNLVVTTMPSATHLPTVPSIQK
jgi:hypothetical protein